MVHPRGGAAEIHSARSSAAQLRRTLRKRGMPRSHCVMHLFQLSYHHLRTQQCHNKLMAEISHTSIMTISEYPMQAMQTYPRLAYETMWTKRRIRTHRPQPLNNQEIWVVPCTLRCDQPIIRGYCFKGRAWRRQWRWRMRLRRSRMTDRRFMKDHRLIKDRRIYFRILTWIHSSRSRTQIVVTFFRMIARAR